MTKPDTTVRRWDEESGSYRYAERTTEPYTFTGSEVVRYGMRGVWWGVIIGAPLWSYLGYLVGKAVNHG